MDAAAPMSIITAAARNTTVSPEWNGSVINSGKNVLPVSTSALTPGASSAPEGSSNSPIGLYPRNAANKLPTGGVLATSCATEAETPCA